MSGGFFDYDQYKIGYIIDKLERAINRIENDIEDEYSYRYEYNNETLAKFKLARDVLYRAQNMVHRIDWLLSGDDNEDSFHLRWAEEKLDD